MILLETIPRILWWVLLCNWDTILPTPPENIEDSNLAPAELDAAVFGPVMDPAAEESAAAPRCHKPDCEDIGFEIKLGPEEARSPCCKPELDVIFTFIFMEVELELKIDRSPQEPDRHAKFLEVAPRLLCEPDHDGILDGSSLSDSVAPQRIQGLSTSRHDVVALNLRRQHFKPLQVS